MRLALAAFVLALPIASSAEAPARPKAAPAAALAPICGDDLRVRHARRSPQAPRLKRLDELPPGDLTLTVVNRVGDCIEPLVVRQRFGATGQGTGR